MCKCHFKNLTDTEILAISNKITFCHTLYIPWGCRIINITWAIVLLQLTCSTVRSAKAKMSFVLCIVGRLLAEYMLRLLQRNRSNNTDYIVGKTGTALRTSVLPLLVTYMPTLCEMFLYFLLHSISNNNLNTLEETAYHSILWF